MEAKLFGGLADANAFCRRQRFILEAWEWQGRVWFIGLGVLAMVRRVAVYCLTGCPLKPSKIRRAGLMSQ